jgi:hypothetical protein
MSYDQTVTVVNVGRVVERFGKPVHLDQGSFQLACNCQPVKGLELLLVPEGDRQREQYWLFAETLDRPLTINQTVIFNSLNFQVQAVELWGDYQKARIMRIDVGPNASNNFERKPEVAKPNGTP